MNDYAAFLLQHWELWLATAMILALILFFEIRERKNGIAHVTTHEAVQLVNREQALVVDVRDEKAFQEGHILGARSIPLASLPTQFSQLEKYKEKPLILVCQTGNQSMNALRILRRHGFKKIYSLKGGLSAWRIAGLPTVK